MADLHRTQVTFAQEDMADAVYDLPFPRSQRHGSTLFTEDVLWAEVWLAERKTDGMVWTGTIRDGELYLDQSAKGGVLHGRGAKQKRPSLLNAGYYKIWIDAWLRPGEDVYAEDRLTWTDYYEYDDASRWKPAPIPPRRFWQDIHVKPAPGKRQAIVRVKSRRFHWLYRLSRIIFTLDKLLETFERDAALVSVTRDRAVYLLTLLNAMEDSNVSAFTVKMLNQRAPVGDDPQKWPEWRKLREMQVLLKNAFVTCDDFVRWGTGGNAEAIADHQHLSNVAHLLWRLINDRDFQRDSFAVEPILATQHRALLARIPNVLNRVPWAYRSTELTVDGEERAVGVGVKYGEEFWKTFGRDFLGRMASGRPGWIQQAGSTGAAPDSKSSDAHVKWLDGVRKYCWSMFNNLSILIAKKPADLKKLADVLEKIEPNIFYAVNQEIEKYRKLGQSDAVQNLIKDRDILRMEDAEVKKRIGWSEYDNFQELDAKLREARGQRVAGERVVDQEERLSNALKRGNPLALYAVEGFEIFVKTLVAREAIRAFREEVEKGQGRLGSRTSVEAFLRVADVPGTILRSTAFKSFVEWVAKGARPTAVDSVRTWLEHGDAAGRWISVGVDLYSAWTYSTAVFSNAYGDALLERYVPEDAVTAYGFALVIWGGKWLNALGSTVGARSKHPLGYLLQGLGYLFQGVGEMGTAFVDVGGREHKVFNDAHTGVVDLARDARLRLESRGFDPYPSRDAQRVMSMSSMLDWRGVNRDLYRGLFGNAARS